MNQTQSPSQSRANDLWRHLVGMYGGDALERKFGKAPPAEWTAMLSRLKDFEIDRGVRRLAYSGKAHLPSLPEFTRLCRSVGEDEFDEGERRPALPPPDQFQGDGWDIAANRHLLAYISAHHEEFPGTPASFHAMRVSKTPNADASGEFVEHVRKLVAAKNAWAKDMREWGHEPSEAEQRWCWDVHMREVT